MFNIAQPCGWYPGAFFLLCVTVRFRTRAPCQKACIDIVLSIINPFTSVSSNFNSILKHTYSQLTVRVPLLELFSHGLLAWHMYSPDWFLLTLVSTSGFPKKRVPVLTTNQETDGIGIPVTAQFNLAFFPSTAVTFSTCSMTDPSKSEQNQWATLKLRVLFVKFLIISIAWVQLLYLVHFFL